jgi:pilus assembly protein CpaB
MRQSLALIVSIVLGLLAVFAMKNYINQEKKSSIVQVDMVEVIFSKRHLPSRSVLKNADLYPVFLPSDSTTPDMIKRHEVVEILGKSIQREINRGGPLFHSDFLGAQQKNISIVSKGRRLVSISVNQVSGVSGLIRPGQRVDILFSSMTSRLSSNKAEAETSLLLENISVYATDSQTIDIPLAFNQKHSGYSTITFSVTPLEALILTSATRQGQITLLLRSKDDFTASELKEPVDSKSLLPLSRKANELRWKTLIEK